MFDLFWILELGNRLRLKVENKKFILNKKKKKVKWFKVGPMGPNGVGLGF